MNQWASAFVIRALRQDARFVSQHVMRAGLAVVILLLFLQHVATYSISMRVGVGGSFAQTVMYCCYAAVTLLGGVYFSSAIVEEKEEQTLPLLRLTGASPLAILIGKSGPRLVSVVLLLLVITPFLTLAITLGAVLIRGLLTAHLVVAGVFLFLSHLLFAPMTAKVVGEGFDAPGKFTRRTRSPRRVHGRALMWKSWRLLSGGWFWLIVRVIGFPLGVIGIVAAVAWGIGESPVPGDFWGALLGVGAVLFVGHFIILLDRIFTVEIQQKTLSSLLMLPMSRKSLCTQLIVGLIPAIPAIPAIVASLSCAVCGFVLMMATESRPRQWPMGGLTSPWFFEFFLMVGSTLVFGLYLSVRLRHGGMLIAILLLWFVGPIIGFVLWTTVSLRTYVTGLIGLLFSTLNIRVNTLQMDRSEEVAGHILRLDVQTADPQTQRSGGGVLIS